MPVRLSPSARSLVISALPRGRFVSAKDVRGLHPKLEPFFIDPHPSHEDVYCFDGDLVVVYAIHAIVAQWPSLDAWLVWLTSLQANN